MAFGSYIRFGLGIALSAEILRLWLSGGQLSGIAIGLSVILLILSAMYFLFRF